MAWPQISLLAILLAGGVAYFPGCVLKRPNNISVTPTDQYDENESTIRIGEESGVEKVCIQWHIDDTHTDYGWLCLDIHQLRKELFNTRVN